MKITVRKIAEEAGVSPASVSRYINGSEEVSSEIAGKVDKDTGKPVEIDVKRIGIAAATSKK